MPLRSVDHDPAASQPRLTVYTSGSHPRTFPLSAENPTTIGRAADCGLFLNDVGCSRRHCVIEFQDGRWIVRDLDSKNGTLVDGKPILEHVLSEGEIISLGNSWLIFQGADHTSIADEESVSEDDTGVAPALRVPDQLASSRDRDSRPSSRLQSPSRKRSANDPGEDTESLQSGEDELIGSSAVLAAMMEHVRHVAETDTTVLIRGESGVGKELVARAIHRFSRRYDPAQRNRFVSVNCAALTESLLESELFGHERGAFTGAYDQKKGKFELSHKGTLLLDEIGEMSPSIQAKFLRVLEGHSFERVGGQRPISVDVRVIAATNANLEGAVQQGLFRTDLYFRLNVLSIEVPPLRSRVEDIPELAEYFLEKFARRAGRMPPKLTDEALRRLSHHRWPGNIRELRNMLERAVVLYRADRIDADQLQFANLPTNSDDASYEGMSLEAVELQHILRTLRATQWNKSKTARILGIERSTLDRKLKRHDVQPPEGFSS